MILLLLIHLICRGIGSLREVYPTNPKIMDGIPDKKDTEALIILYGTPFEA